MVMASRRGSRIQKGGGVVQEFRLENRSYPDVHDFSLRMQVIIANANNIADSRGGGGGSEHQQKPLYPRLASELNYYLLLVEVVVMVLTGSPQLL